MKSKFQKRKIPNGLSFSHGFFLLDRNKSLGYLIPPEAVGSTKKANLLNPDSAVWLLAISNLELFCLLLFPPA